jgi:hypothetical protein
MSKLTDFKLALVGRTNLFLILMIALALSSRVSGQKLPPDQEVLESMKVHLDAITAQARGDQMTVNLCHDLRKLADSLKEIQARYQNDDYEIYSTTTPGDRTLGQQNREKHTNRLTEEYVASLRSDDELLSTLISDQVSKSDRDETLAVIREDLRLKKSFLSKGSFIEEMKIGAMASDPQQMLTLFTARAGDVLVTAQTLHGKQDIPGYRIWFVPQGWAKHPDHFTSFSTLSSPTRGEYIPPGPYFVWAEKGAIKTERSLVRVGSQGPNHLIQFDVVDN